MDAGLVDGDHDYLSLILTDIECARIISTPTSFVAPNFPGVLTIGKNVEKALLRHIQNALEEKFIKHMVDEDTGLTEDDIQTVLEYLLSNYGKVPSEEVKKKEAGALNISFNPADPMVLLFCHIEQLQKLATSASTMYLDAQILEFGLTLIRSTLDFEKA